MSLKYNKKPYAVPYQTPSFLSLTLRRTATSLLCTALLVTSTPASSWAQQTPPGASTDAAAEVYSAGQLDALLAPIALYPDQLLTQVLMASSYPLEVVSAARWVQDPANKSLTGSALESALAAQSWDPSIKSLVPFPQVLTMMNDKLDWLQQLGYAMAEQQSDVMDSVQRLRQQARTAGELKTTEQQIVTVQGPTIVILPAQPQIVYVPVYNPTAVYGVWRYPAYPPVYLPPPPAYYASSAVVAGLAFGAGIAISASLWGWATPNWGYKNVNVNVNHYNNINVNRPPIHNNNWKPRPPATGPGGGGYRPPSGPVGTPGNRPGAGGAAGRPPSQANRPPAGQTPKPARPSQPATKPAGGGQGARPGKPPAVQPGRPSAGQGGKPPGAGQAAKPSVPSNKLPGQAGKPAGGQVSRPPGQMGQTPGNPAANARPNPSQGVIKPTPGQGGVQNFAPGGKAPGASAPRPTRPSNGTKPTGNRNN